jgi:NTE family protein
MFINKKIALALSSGSAKGLAHFGVIDALLEKGYEIQAVSGTSAGSIVAALFAFGKIEEFKKFAFSLDKKKSRGLFDINFLPTSGLVGGKKLQTVLEEYFGELKIEDSPIPLYICTTSLETGNTIYITNGKVVDALRASCAIPGLFEPYKVKSIYCVDGAISTPLPIKILVAEGFKKIIAVDLNYHLDEYPIKDMPNIISVLSRTINILSKHITCGAELIDDNCKIIRPDLSQFSFFDFHLAKEFIKKGYEDTVKQLN